MKPSTYFLVNDTRYDNHHGGLTVVRNLHLGLARRGWTCTGSLPVSATAGQLRRHRRELAAAQLIVVNGEGSLHHDGRNAGRLYDVCAALLEEARPIALINAVWQDNDPARWKPLLERLAAISVRDRRSQDQLRAMGVAAECAPDLTFYDYPRFTAPPRARYGCTDSVLKSWTEKVLRLCAQDREIEFLTLFAKELRYRRGFRDWDKAVKYRLYPRLWTAFGLPVPPRYRSLPFADAETAAFLGRLASCRAVCVARYHALCFALQQNVPFVAVASNSHKSEALLEEVGLPLDRYLIGPDEFDRLKERLEQAVRDYPAVQTTVAEFNRRAKERLEQLFDRLAGLP